MPSMTLAAKQENDTNTIYQLFLILGFFILLSPLFLNDLSLSLWQQTPSFPFAINKRDGVGKPSLEGEREKPEHSGESSTSPQSRLFSELHVSDAERALFLLKPIPINRASAELLATIPGIGPGLSQEIVDYIRENGELEDAPSLKKIKGIGEKKAMQISTYIRI